MNDTRIGQTVSGTETEEAASVFAASDVDAVGVEAAFLRRVVQERRRVNLITTNGYQMQGHIVSYDDGAVLFKMNDGIVRLVYRHAISTIYELAGTPQTGRAVSCGFDGLGDRQWYGA